MAANVGQCPPRAKLAASQGEFPTSREAFCHAGFDLRRGGGPRRLHSRRVPSQVESCAHGGCGNHIQEVLYDKFHVWSWSAFDALQIGCVVTQPCTNGATSGCSCVP